ncbi:hypothetical protein AB0D97_14850 [Streptomyces roseus]|uniref:hypothetical protein n=1 Tax=Streptomyces roseus TaxID=66430 RepID=UPI0033C9DECE
MRTSASRAAGGRSPYGAEAPFVPPVVRVLAASGPSSIREPARGTGVTHSAASQTVAQVAREALVSFAPGADARQRIVRLTPKAESLLPVLDAEGGRHHGRHHAA